MGKADTSNAKHASENAIQTAQKEFGGGINETQGRIGTVQPRSDAERDQIWKGYTGFSNKSAGDYLGGLSGSPASGSSGGGGGGGPVAAPQKEDYVGVWEELMGKEGGFDPTRLGNLTSSATSLRDFASRGGLTAEDRANVNREPLLEFERTGGYSDIDKANIRDRSNRAIPAYYQNLQDSMNRRQGVNNFGPGTDRVGFKMARQGAQDVGNQTRDTELGISDAVRQGRMDASKFLSGQNLNLSDLSSRNTLQGYKDASGIDLDTQQLINQSRLGAAGSKSQDQRSRDATGAASGAAAASRADANARWAAQMEQADRMFGTSGLLDTYKAGPSELMFNQDLLRGYRQDLSGAGFDDARMKQGLASLPGWSDTFGKIAGGVGSIIPG